MIEKPRCKFIFRADLERITTVSILAINEEEAIKKANKKYPNSGIRRVHNEPSFNEIANYDRTRKTN